MAKGLTPYSVTELTKNIKFLLEDSFEMVYLKGEISGLSRPISGHLYFNIKDKRSQISAVMFKGSSLKQKFQLENGLDGLFFGRISVYEPRGTYQIIVEQAEPLGSGILALSFEQLKSKLEAEGLFDPVHKKEIPKLPKTIGIITSPTGAAIKDILNVALRRNPNLNIIINPVKVQGKNSSFEIAKAIRQFQKFKELDLIILGRGGGSIEDLWAFNEERVARAIFKSKIPIISAVGHETDFTISDFVSDLRAPTPSAAAEISIPVLKELIERVEYFETRLTNLMNQKINSYKEQLYSYKKRLRSPKAVIESRILRVDELTNRLNQYMKNELINKKNRLDRLIQQIFSKSPAIKIENYQNRVDFLSDKLKTLVELKVNDKRAKLKELAHVLDSVSPLAILKRGYSVTTDQKKKPIIKTDQVKIGENLITNLQDGKTISTINEIIKE